MAAETTKPFGEIVGSSLNRWLVHCWHTPFTLPFGTLVKANESLNSIVGVVANIEIITAETARTPFPYKQSPAALQEDHPEIFELMHTQITCLSLGTIIGTTVEHGSPPLPPTIHAFVLELADDEKRLFVEDHYYIHTLMSPRNSAIYTDDLLVALIKEVAKVWKSESTWLKDLLRHFAASSGNDSGRVRRLAEQIEKVTGKKNWHARQDSNLRPTD